MATTNYYTFEGMLVAEDQVGGTGFRTYGPDALGSVCQTYDSTGTLQDTFRYSPYGRSIVSTGPVSAPAFLWAGSLGYRNNARAIFECYVRARHYSISLSNWTSVDPLWPRLRAYVYTVGRPTTLADPSGLAHLANEATCNTPSAYYTTGCINITVPIPCAIGPINEIDVSFQICKQNYNAGTCAYGQSGASECTEYSGSVTAYLKLPKAPSLSDAENAEQLGNALVKTFLGNGITALPVAAHLPGCICIGTGGSISIGVTVCAVLFSVNVGIKFEIPGSPDPWLNVSFTSCGSPGFGVTAEATYSVCK